MQLRTRNIKILTILLVALLFMASSGFTMELHRCLMTHSTCCDESGSDKTQGAGPSLAANETMPDCCSTKIAGGLNSSPSIFEKSSASDHQKQFHIVPVVNLLPQADQANLAGQSSLSLFLRVSLPPPIARYILTSALLI